jgi:hypothetical protein
MSQTNGTTYDLYHALPAVAQPLPEAAFSMTLKGKLDGQDALLTVRGMTIAEFQANVHAVRGLLDRPQAAPVAASHGDGWCAKHNTAMQENHKDGRTWLSHKTAEGWCKGK